MVQLTPVTVQHHDYIVSFQRICQALLTMLLACLGAVAGYLLTPCRSGSPDRP
jgi:hypothetical protein